MIYYAIIIFIVFLIVGQQVNGDEGIDMMLLNFLNTVGDESTQAQMEEFFNAHPTNTSAKSRPHNNNWAVLVSTSKFWYNYRHMSNTLSIYHTIKKQGIPDSQIILMLADDMACNARNRYPAQIFNNRDQSINLYGENVEVDYRGYEVTVDSFMRVLTDRHAPMVTKNKRLLSNKNSNLLIYMTGHGGNQFLKFQDVESISAHDLAITLHEMYLMERFNEVLLMVDTCQAGTLFQHISSPGVVSIGSSAKGENSVSRDTNYDVGVAIIDEFTYATLDYFENLKWNHQQLSSQHATVGDLFASYRRHQFSSSVVPVTHLAKRPLHSMPLSDFFSQVVPLSFTENTYWQIDAKEEMIYLK